MQKLTSCSNREELADDSGGAGKLARLLLAYRWHIGLGEEPCNLQGTVRFNESVATISTGVANHYKEPFFSTYGEKRADWSPHKVTSATVYT